MAVIEDDAVAARIRDPNALPIWARVADALDVAIADLRHTWDHGLARALGVEPGPVRETAGGSGGSAAASTGEAN